MLVEVTKLILTQFTDEAIVVSALLLFFFFTSIVLYWLCSKKTSKNLSHKIPANVLGNYVENATANKESLNSFTSKKGNPSVVSPGNLRPGANLKDISTEEFNQKIAEIASLKHKIVNLEGQVQEFEKRLSKQPKEGGLSIAQSMKERLTNIVRGKSSNPNKDLEKKLIKANKENDKYKKKLKEYEVISNDIASLEEMKKENEELKKSIKSEPKDDLSDLTIVKDNSQKEKEDRIVIEANEKEPEEKITVKQVTSKDDDDSEDNDLELKEKTKEAVPNDGEQKSTEDLLSEFEKMLG
ncbi:MAG: hypothetical protein OXB84_04595 [Halobacteriovoraceae bacterium]|nr:hypothetical protein [Halobacteriovoraceae bacterium]